MHENCLSIDVHTKEIIDVKGDYDLVIDEIKQLNNNPQNENNSPNKNSVPKPGNQINKNCSFKLPKVSDNVVYFNLDSNNIKKALIIV